MKNVLHYQTQKKDLLISFMKAFFAQQKKAHTENQLQIALSRLEHFSTQGKMLRGVFVMLAYEMYGGIITQDILQLASVIELTHATLLIHDDIMDNDEKRRNELSMFAQYAIDAKNQQYTNPTTYGKSVAMVVGDTALFLAFELLSTLPATPEVKKNIQITFSQEMVRVASGQVLDFDFGQSSLLPEEKSIESMYTLKTGGYTFSLPFACGALLADAPAEEREKLSTLTRILGNTFQLKDDELGIMGDSEVTGKSPGSDVREGKKTLLWMRLYTACTQKEKEMLESCLGTSLSRQQIQDIRTLLQKYRIIEAIQTKIDSDAVLAFSIVDSLHVQDSFKDLLKELVEYNAHRTA